MPELNFRLLPVAPFALVAALALGCGGGDGVQTYTAPKSGEPAKPGPGGEAPVGPAAAGEYRILGAMFPAESPAWFFKLTGSAEDLARYEAGFDQLLASVSLPADGPPKFDAPEGWKVGPGRAGMVTVAATIKTPDGKGEVTIIPSGGGVEPNLKRWAGQLGKAFGPDDVAKVTKPIDAKGVKGLKADLRGPTNPGGKGGPMMGMGGK